MRLIVAIAALLTVLSTSAEARHAKHHHRAHHVRTHHVAAMQGTLSCISNNSGRMVCGGAVAPSIRMTNTASYSGDARIVGGRPSGCPHAFCGCEASRYVFGRIIPELNLAANWLRKFPRTSPAPGMVAARNHHVFVLLSHVGGSDWLAHDGNSGGGKTREHVVSISRYTIVDPHGSRMASK